MHLSDWHLGSKTCRIFKWGPAGCEETWQLPVTTKPREDGMCVELSRAISSLLFLLNGCHREGTFASVSGFIVCLLRAKPKAPVRTQNGKWAAILRQRSILQAHIDLSLTKLMSVDMRHGVSPQRHQRAAAKTDPLWDWPSGRHPGCFIPSHCRREGHREDLGIRHLNVSIRFSRPFSYFPRKRTFFFFS